MKKYIVVTESGADLSHNIIGKHHIHVLPMHVMLGNKDYLDGFISIDEQCDYYDKTGKIPTTSSVNPDEYRQVFEKIRTQNPNAIIIHISYSSHLSSCLQNSMIASNSLNDDIGMNNVYHIDSLSLSAGMAFVVIKAIKLIEENPDMPPEDLILRIKEYAEKTRFFFLPNNLDYLRVGGRVSNAQYLGANILKLKPLIETKDGELISSKKYRGSMKHIVQQMVNDFFTKFNIDKDLICLGDEYKVAEDIRTDMEKYVKELGVKEVVWLKAGSITTTHAGPGGIGLAGIEKN